MAAADALVAAARFGLAALYLAGAASNLADGRRHPDDVYGSLATTAWLGPYRWLISEVILPNGALFAVLLGGFEPVLAGLLPGGGQATAIGLAAGLAFCLLVVPAMSVGGALANLALAAAQGALLWGQLRGSPTRPQVT